MTRVLCWCPDCETGNHIALKRDRQVRDWLAANPELADSIGLLWGPDAAKAFRPALTKEAPVAHVIDDQYDYDAAAVIHEAVAAVIPGWGRQSIGKRADGPSRLADPFTALQTVYAKAMAGEPVAVASWAAIEAVLAGAGISIWPSPPFEMPVMLIN